MPKKEVKKTLRTDATTEARMNRLASMALDRVEQQLLDGSIKATVLVELMKFASPKRKEEIEKVHNENELLLAKVSAIKSAESQEKVYKDAIEAMRKYTGNGGAIGQNEDV